MCEVSAQNDDSPNKASARPATYDRAVPIARCLRCRAEDISADAHPTRLLQNGQTVPVFVCRNCFRPAELEFQIACEANQIPYRPLAIRESLRLLRDFYRARHAASPDDPYVAGALADIERRLSIEPVGRAPKLDA